MSEVNSDDVKKRYNPQHPLPEGIQKMDRDETICRYCGVSYLIHNEIKGLEKKIKKMEKELEHYRGCEERENKLKVELQVLQDQRGEFEMTITVKEAAISTLTNNLHSQEATCERLRNQHQETEQQFRQVEVSNKHLKDRNNLLEKALPDLKMELQKQKMSLEDIHTFTDARDKQMKEEINILLSHVKLTCENELQEKSKLQNLVINLEDRFVAASAESETLKQRLNKQEQKMHELRKLDMENKELQQKYALLETSQAALKQELESSVEQCRSLHLEIQQFKEQCKNKSNEVEELVTGQRRKEMAMELTIQKLKSDLKQKETDLLDVRYELQVLQNKFEQHQHMEEELNRKTSKTLKETKELKESFFKAKEEIDSLKQEREAMITSHQNRIEQLRESFKEKLANADTWQEKLEAAIQNEKDRHSKELQALETRLKESFVMELEIEKGKYRELMKKYQTASQENEDKLRAQLQSIESRYKSEIADLNELLQENRRKSNEMEDELRKEIANLKGIIKDLEGRLGRLGVGNEDLVMTLKAQLRETHQELEDTREALDKQTKASDALQEEIKHLQETVRNECEERFELTEALSAAKEELLSLKKPSGYPRVTPRPNSNHSLALEDSQTSLSSRRSVSESQQLFSNQQTISMSRTYGDGTDREYTITNSNNMVFMGENSSGARQVGGNTKKDGGSLAENRRRIATILGRK